MELFVLTRTTTASAEVVGSYSTYYQAAEAVKKDFNSVIRSLKPFGVKEEGADYVPPRHDEWDNVLTKDGIALIPTVEGLSSEHAKTVWKVAKTELKYLPTLKAQDLARCVMDSMNTFGFKNDEFAESVCREHKTLQQNFFRLIVAVIKRMAKSEYYDKRNESSVLIAKAICEKVPEIDSGIPMY